MGRIWIPIAVGVLLSAAAVVAPHLTADFVVR